MTASAQVTNDQDVEVRKTEKAKPVAVDPQAKQLTQAGRFTPEERVAAIKELLAEDIADNKARFEKAVKGQEGGGWSSDFAAAYQTKRGTIYIRADDKSENPLTDITLGEITVELVTKDTKQTSTERMGFISSDGEFVRLNRSTKTYINLDEKKGRPHTIKSNENLSSEWAERFVDGVIKDALKAKQSGAK